jgi:hypothetical protein
MKLQEHYSLSLARNTSEQASNADRDGIITLIPKKNSIYIIYIVVNGKALKIAK